MTKKDTRKLRCSGTMTESQFLAWVRSALRSKSLRWPPRSEALELARRPYKGSNKLQKWEYSCSICKQWYKAKDVCVDHYPKPAGSILSVEDIGAFVNNLYCEVDNLRVLCVPCHEVHTLADKEGVSFEKAKAMKKVIEITKQPAKKVIAWLAERGYTSASDVSNATKRKELVITILKGEGNV